MHVKQNTYVGEREKILITVKDINAKIEQNMNLLRAASQQELEFNVEINRYSQDSGIRVQLSGVNDAAVKIQCAINGLNQTLAMLNTLPEMAKELNETIKPTEEAGEQKKEEGIQNEEL